MSDSTLDPRPQPIPSTDADVARATHREPGLMRATALMSVGTALSRLTGFVRLAVMAWAIGGAESKLPDTYNLANSMPNVVYQLVLGEILATVFVPVFVEHIATRSREESWRLASTILNLGFIVATVFSAITVLLAPWLIQIYTFRIEDPSLRLAQQEVGAFLLRLLMPQMIFYALGAVMTGLLNAHRRFAAPMFAPILNNLIVAGTFLIFGLTHDDDLSLRSLSTGDIVLLGGGTTLGVVAMTVILVPFVRRLPGRYRMRDLDWRHPAIRHVGNLAKYSFAYVIVNQVGLWVIQVLANGVNGGVTAYQASWILYQLPYGIFAVSVMTALVPGLAEHHVRGDRPGMRRDISLGLRTTAFIVLPAAAGFVALAGPIIRLLLERGVFSAESTPLFADTLQMMAIGLGSYAAFQQIMRAFYAMQDTRTPWLINIVAVGASILVALPLFAALGVPGLGLAHAFSYTSGALIGLSVLRRRLGGIDGRALVSSHLRILTAAVLTGVVAWVVARAIDSAVVVETFAEQLTQVGAAVAAGVVTYAMASIVLRVGEFRPLLSMVKRTTRRRSGEHVP